MLWQVYCVRDRATATFARPWFVAARGAAIRSFGDEINRNAVDNPLYMHSDDYDLFHVGEFDDSTAELFKIQPAQQVAVGKDLKIK